MTDIKSIIESVDLATRQKLFFYELCKAGVVKFNSDNPEHIKILTQMVEAVTKSFDEANYSEEPEAIQIEMKNKHNLDLLIVTQLLKHTKNEEQ